MGQLISRWCYFVAVIGNLNSILTNKVISDRFYFNFIFCVNSCERLERTASSSQETMKSQCLKCFFLKLYTSLLKSTLTFEASLLVHWRCTEQNMSPDCQWLLNWRFLKLHFSSFYDLSMFSRWTSYAQTYLCNTMAQELRFPRVNQINILEASSFCGRWTF